MCLLTITQKFCLSVIITDIIYQPLTETHLPTNQSLINLCYSDVRNLTSILSYCLGPKCVSSNNDTKALSLCDSCFPHICITGPKNHLPKNIINLLYGDMESLSSIISWCNGVKIEVSRKDPRALSHEDNHLFITLLKIIYRLTSNSLTFSTMM